MDASDGLSQQKLDPKLRFWAPELRMRAIMNLYN